MNPLVREIRNFIDETFLSDQGSRDVANVETFLKRGIIDSAGVLELLSFLEEKYPIRIAHEEGLSDNHDSVNCLVTFLQRKLADVRDSA